MMLLKFPGAFKSLNSATLSTESNFHKHLSLNHVWLPLWALLYALMYRKYHYIWLPLFSASPMPQIGQTVGHSSCIDGTCLFFILERMLVKKLWKLSSAISVERRVHPVQVKCFPLSWLYINQILACIIQQKIFKKPLHILQGIMSALLLPLLWVLLFHHLYVPNKVALTNEILPSIACFSAFFKKEHDFFNIFSTGWFQIICQLMLKKCLQQINICSLCPHFVISTAPKLLVRNIETKETFKKLRLPVFKIISTNLETVTLAFAPAFLKFSGTIKSFNSPTLSTQWNLHKHLSLQHFWVL